MILITGASSGIGEATARLFAEKKRDLILLARRMDRLQKLADELRSDFGIQVHTFELDVCNYSEIKTFAKSQNALLSQVSVLINNAGLALGFHPFQETTPMEWDVMIDTNIKGVFGMTREILPYLIQNRNGHIILIGSTAGHWTYPNGNIYSATKAAIKSFTESLRLDLNGTGIRVTEISPGKVETEFSLVRLKDSTKAKAVYEGMQPLIAHDIAEAIFWSVDRPPHVNIQEIVVYPTDQASPTLSVKR